MANADKDINFFYNQQQQRNRATRLVWELIDSIALI
jgi:hypothetical protein